MFWRRRKEQGLADRIIQVLMECPESCEFRDRGVTIQTEDGGKIVIAYPLCSSGWMVTWPFDLELSKLESLRIGKAVRRAKKQYIITKILNTKLFVCSVCGAGERWQSTDT